MTINRLPNLCNLELLSVYDIDALTYHELVYKILARLNLTIDEMIKLDIYVKDDLLKMQEQINLLLSTGLETEVVKQLEKWLLEGKFADIINKTIFDELNSKVDILTKNNDYLMTENVNVKEFGAVGDGITDDTASIKKAIDKLKNKKGVLYFPSGVYKTSTIILNDNMSIVGETKYTVIKSLSDNLIKLNGNNISITNITLDGNTPEVQTERLISTLTSANRDNLNIENCMLGNMTANYTNCIDIQNFKNVRILNNTFKNLFPANGGAYFISLYGQIEDFLIHNNNFSKIYGNYPGAMIKIDAVNVDSSTTSLYPYAPIGLKNPTSGEITSNILKGYSKNLLEISGQNVNIKSNTFQIKEDTNNTDSNSLVNFKNSDSCTLTNNTFLLPSSYLVAKCLNVEYSSNIMISDLSVEFQGNVTETYPSNKKAIVIYNSTKISVNTTHFLGLNFLDTFIDLKTVGIVDIQNLIYRNLGGGIFTGIHIRDKKDEPNISLSNIYLQASKMSYPLDTMYYETTSRGYVYINECTFKGDSAFGGATFIGTDLETFNRVEIQNSYFDRRYKINTKYTKNIQLIQNILPAILLSNPSVGFTIHSVGNTFHGYGTGQGDDYCYQLHLETEGSYNVRSLNNYNRSGKSLFQIFSNTLYPTSKLNSLLVVSKNDNFDIDALKRQGKLIDKNQNIPEEFYKCFHLHLNQAFQDFNYGVELSQRKQVILAHNTLFATNATSSNKMYVVGNTPDGYSQYSRELKL